MSAQGPRKAESKQWRARGARVAKGQEARRQPAPASRERNALQAPPRQPAPRSPDTHYCHRPPLPCNASPPSCITFAKLYTTKGRTFVVGNPDAKGEAYSVTGPDGSHVFSLGGFFGPGCAAPAAQVFWGTEECAKKTPAAKPATKEVVKTVTKEVLVRGGVVWGPVAGRGTIGRKLQDDWVERCR